MHKVYLAWLHLVVALLRWSAVKCLEAKHDPALAKRAPRPAAADAAGPSKAAQKPAANSAAGQIAGIMAGMCGVARTITVPLLERYVHIR